MFNFIKNEKGAVIPFLFISAYLLSILLIPFRACASVEAGLDALSHHEFAKAERIFAEQADKGDAHAMYWLGNTYQLEGGMKRLDAGRILLKAANMGDPWAMNRLDPSNNESPCGMFGWPCDSKWLDKALATWKKQAKQGDGNAELALLLRDRPWYMRFIPVLGKKMYADKLVDAFNHGSDYAAFKILDTNINDKYSYIKKVANKGSRAAIYYYGFKYNQSSNEYLKWMKESARKGFSKAALHAMIGYQEKHKYMDAYFYSLLYVNLTGEKQYIDPYYQEWIKNISKEDRIKIQKKVELYIKKYNIRLNKNYSEFSEEFFGIY